jgi:hypothetical protein
MCIFARVAGDFFGPPRAQRLAMRKNRAGCAILPTFQAK